MTDTEANGLERLADGFAAQSRAFFASGEWCERHHARVDAALARGRAYAYLECERLLREQLRAAGVE